MNFEMIGKFKYVQNNAVFPLGQDSLKLGDFATVRAGDKICDLGTGSGILLLLLANRQQNLQLFGLDSHSDSVQLAQYNLEQNGLSGQILLGKIQDKLLKAGDFDLVISNPPYFTQQSGRGDNPARQEISCNLEALCREAGRLLRNGGRFALVHRPERLVDVFCQMREAGIEPKRMQLVAHSPSHTPSAVLVEGVRQGRPALTVEPLLT